jgi:hypothetical protein
VLLQRDAVARLNSGYGNAGDGSDLGDGDDR